MILGIVFRESRNSILLLSASVFHSFLIKIALKYHPLTKEPAMTNIKRVSTPGLRKYVGVEDMPRVLNGLGIAIISTSKGLMTDKEARALNIGGEVICYIS